MGVILNMLTFSVNKDINEVVRLRGIADARPTSDYGRAWWSEAWIKALEGRTDDTIDLDAYGYACERNIMRVNSKRETALLTAEEIEGGLKGVASTVASYIDKNVDTIIESSEIATFIEQFKFWYEELLIVEGVNLWTVLTQARQFITPSVDRLRGLIAEYNIGEVVEGVLKNAECIVALEAEFSDNIFS